MTRRFGLLLAAVATLAALLAMAATSARERPLAFGADRDRYEIGHDITIRFVNNTNRVVRMDPIWHLGLAQTDEEVASYHWSDEERVVAPGEQRIWVWSQLGPACYGQCQNVSPGEQVRAGRYVVTATIDGVPLSDAFEIGSFFTLGFEGRPNVSFVVFVATQDEVDRMNEEAAAEDKTLIVSGLVRKGQRYNPDWSYVMGSRSIVLGEVFIEVCDASPGYVERHRDQWMGERWCPWSSYVARAGR
ncbi:MAG: hypothetical protein M3238_03040 [Actinomycetota bacterium]|nr:hypothetical protein [Actinomycetota bacterium]